MILSLVNDAIATCLLPAACLLLLNNIGYSSSSKRISGMICEGLPKMSRTG